MSQTFPTKATFANGEGQQQSASMYLHGSPDGGEDVYSVGGAAAYWEDDDGGVGQKSGDTEISFAGTEADDAGTGGPYSSRLGGLLLRPQMVESPDYEVEIDFQFAGTAKGERVAVFARCVPANLTKWFNKGTAGTGSPHYFRSMIQGVGLEIDDSGAAVLFKYDSAGARTTIATQTTAVGTTAHTLTLKVMGDPGTITAQLDAADAFAASSYDLTSGDAPSRGHAALALSRTQAADYPKISAFNVEDYTASGAPVTKLRDEWTRTPAIEGSITATGSTGVIAGAIHKAWEWGGFKNASLSSEKVGPFLLNGHRRYGPKLTASAITGNNTVEWLDLWLRGADSATQVANVRWTWETTDATVTIATANIAIGCAVRATKSAEDGSSTPTLAAATGYLMRLVFASPAPYFELVRIVAGVETVLETSRPVSAALFYPGEYHVLRLHVQDSGGDPVLNGIWQDQTGENRVIFQDVIDDDASKITATNSAGIYCKLHGMGGKNPAFHVQRFTLDDTSIPPPTWDSEAEIEGEIPFNPEFPEDAQDIYRTLQDVTERLYVRSRREFIAPRTVFPATWVLNATDGATLYAYLVARQDDRKGFSIDIDGTSADFVIASEDIALDREAGGTWVIGPVELMEVL